jgi:hypothetical protein
MSKRRLFPALLILALLSGCGGKKPSGVVSPKGGGVGAMDSPIVVSDDLHVRHTHQMGKSNPDFQILPSGQMAAFSDSGLAVQHIQCEFMTATNPSGLTPPDCSTKGVFNVSGVNSGTGPGISWELDLFDASSTLLATLKSANGSPLCSSASVFCEVTITPGSNSVFDDTQDNGGDDSGNNTNNDNDAKGGTDMAVTDAKNTSKNFISAKLTLNLGSASPSSVTLNCKNASTAGEDPHDCHLRIQYQ